MPIDIRSDTFASFYARIDSVSFQSYGQNAAGHRAVLVTNVTVFPPRGEAPQSSKPPNVVARLSWLDARLFAENDVIPLGSFRPLGGYRSLTQPTQERDETSLRFLMDIDGRGIAWIESQRRGRRISLELNGTGDLYVDGRSAGREVRVGSSGSERVPIDRDAWTDFLSALGSYEYVHVEIPVAKNTDDPKLQAAAAAMKDAAAHVGSRRVDDTLAACRKVLDHLDQAGFGGHAPADVINFIKSKASANSLDEKVAALRAATHSFLSSGPHAGRPDDPLDWEDAKLAVSLTALLLRSAPRRLRTP